MAALTRLRAQPIQPGRRARIPAEALLLAGRLRGRGLARDADVAELTRGPGAGRRRAPRRGQAADRGRAPTRADGLRWTSACCAGWPGPSWRSGKDGPGRRWPSSGRAWPWCKPQRDRLGSIDLRTGTAALGAELAAAGLRLALERGSAPLVFAWLERSRAQAFRVRPVRPPADPQAAALLAELRQLSYLIREAELNGSRDPAMVGRHAELQREIREHDWQAGGLGEARPCGRPRRGERGPGAQRAEPGWHPGPGRPDGRGGGAARIGAPGAARRLRDSRRGGQAAERRPRHAGRTAAARPARGRDQGVDPASGGHADGRDRRAAARLRSATAASCSCPAGPLAGIPWGLLPDLRGRPVTVCPSASSWLAAWRRRAGRGGPAPNRPPLLLAGPDLEHAPREVTEIARSYPGCRPLLAQQATVAPRCGPWTAPRSPTWPRTGTTTRRTSCSPGSTWLTAR